MGLGESLAAITPQLINTFGNTITINTITHTYDANLEPVDTVTGTETDKAIVDKFHIMSTFQTDGARVKGGSMVLYTYYEITDSNQIIYKGITYKIDDVVLYPVSDINVLYVVMISRW